MYFNRVFLAGVVNEDAADVIFNGDGKLMLKFKLLSQTENRKNASWGINCIYCLDGTQEYDLIVAELSAGTHVFVEGELQKMEEDVNIVATTIKIEGGVKDIAAIIQLCPPKDFTKFNDVEEIPPDVEVQ